jgi:hypothetical protein
MTTAFPLAAAERMLPLNLVVHLSKIALWMRKTFRSLAVPTLNLIITFPGFLECVSCWNRDVTIFSGGQNKLTRPCGAFW